MRRDDARQEEQSTTTKRRYVSTPVQAILRGRGYCGRNTRTDAMKRIPIAFLMVLAGLSTSAATLGECIKWEGDLVINESSLSLEEIPGECFEVSRDLIISRSTLVDLDGLSNLVSVGGNLEISDSDGLGDVDGLSNLVSIGGDLSIGGSDGLGDVDGLSNLVSVGGNLAIVGNEALGDLDGLGGLTSVEWLAIAYNDGLANVDGLSNLTSVGGNLTIRDNDGLANVDGLSNLTNVGGNLIIRDNDGLENLDGLNGLTSIRSLDVRNNGVLPTRVIQAFADRLISDGFSGGITIEGNRPDPPSMEVTLERTEAKIELLTQVVFLEIGVPDLTRAPLIMNTPVIEVDISVLSVTWEADTPPGTAITIRTRTGYDANVLEGWDEWSDWYQVPGVAFLSSNTSPAFLQVQILFTSEDPQVMPMLHSVSFLAAPPTAVLEEWTTSLPEPFVLNQNYPNPFNSETVISFALPISAAVDLSVYNLSGQKVATLVEGVRQARTYIVRWDGRDGDGRELASGVYLYLLRTVDGQQMGTRKLLLLR